jgi:predicted RNA-binding Zn-ribbon protein involved in translation (DUF1610 family)
MVLQLVDKEILESKTIFWNYTLKVDSIAKSFLCPKCGALLLLITSNKGKWQREYQCLSCGMEGNYKSIAKRSLYYKERLEKESKGRKRSTR